MLQNFASLGGLGLTNTTIQVLEEENITIPIHLLLLRPDVIEKLVKSTGDKRRILKYIQPVSSKGPQDEDQLKGQHGCHEQTDRPDG